MPIWDNAPHQTNSYTVAPSRDSGGGTSLSYTLAQASIPCLINTLSSSEIELYAQKNIDVSHRIGCLTSVLATAITRGMKLTDESGNSYHVEGIESGRGFASIPPFTYILAKQIL